MLLNANINSNKTEILLKEYINLLKKGVSADSILFLTQNSYKKKSILNFLKEKDVDFVAVNTFQGLVYDTICENWEFLSSKIKTGEDKLFPNLCSMELSQYIMKRCVEEVGFKDYFSKINLLHQLFRRYYLILQNDLDEKEVLKRSGILGETWGKEAQKVFKKYEEKTLQYRCFDYLRQLPLFKYVYKNSAYFDKIKYLFVDDADEMTQFEFNFVKHISKNLNDYFIVYDSQGSSRAGYLSAKKDIDGGLRTWFKTQPKILKKDDFIDKRANILYKNFVSEDKINIEKLEVKNYLTRLQMIVDVALKIKELSQGGVKYKDIAIITPELDFSVENFLMKYLPKNSYEILSGNKKLVQNSEVQNILTILKLANSSWKMNIEQYEINSLLKNFLKIPLKYCQNIFTEFKRTKSLEFFEFENKNYENSYKNLLDTIKELEKLTLSESVKLLLERFSNKDSESLNFLQKKIEEFEYLFSDKKENKIVQKNIILQFENSMIAENSVEKEVDTNKIIVSTVQKFIDLNHKVKYQIWLDLTSSQWMVEDVGNIYNAWGFQSDWDGKIVDCDKLKNYTKDKTGRMLRKLALLCSEDIYGCACCYDSSGFENLYGILDYLCAEKTGKDEKKQIIPREDQKPVLDYKNGKLAVAAVPGAGKTTVLLALIIKLLNSDIPAENIFVLTFMDSASKHFKEKLLEYMPDLKILPNISTIHGLCLKILKDNSNYLKVGLEPEFQVCGEMDRKAFIYQALYKTGLKEEDYDKYEKAVSSVKLNPEIDIKNNKNDFKFAKFFENYNLILKENSMIDYDDMLFYAVTLLKNNQDILNFYQEECKYLIEDEAQDSSIIQQELLKLLSGKNNNLIRCGDPNQAITTTFTNADTKGFMDFIEKNKSVKMNISQRSSEPIFSFANKLLEKYSESFFKNIMKGTEYNPKNKAEVELKEFEFDNEEKEFILNTVRKIFEKDKNTSVAILLRNNYQVENYSEFLNSNDIKTVKKIDNLKNNRVFNVILTFFEMLEFPYNNKVLSDGLKNLGELEIYFVTEEEIKLLKNMKTSFINCNPDELESYTLNKFWWDFNYIFSNSNQDVDLLTCLISEYYFDDNQEIENSYMLSQMIKDIRQNVKENQTFMDRLRTVKNLVNFGSIKLLKADNNDTNTVQIMTIHKAKGDEFDYVFVPEMSSKQFSLNEKDVKVSSENYYCECLKPKNKIKTVEELKKEQIDETLRLIYVAITRAKERLFISYSKNFKRGAKKLLPCDIFDLDGNR